jgi:hypothetical protein
MKSRIYGDHENDRAHRPATSGMTEMRSLDAVAALQVWMRRREGIMNDGAARVHVR